MELETYFESPKVSQSRFHQYEKNLEDKVNEIKSEIIKILNERYSIQIDIKNNCIINSIDGTSGE